MIVLQDCAVAGLGERCIAIQLNGLTIVLQQRRLAGGKIVSQYKNCIMIAEAVGCWTVSQHRAATRSVRPRHGAGRTASSQAWRGRARGTHAAGAGARAERAGRRGRGTKGAGRWGARGAGTAAIAGETGWPSPFGLRAKNGSGQFCPYFFGPAFDQPSPARCGLQAKVG